MAAGPYPTTREPPESLKLRLQGRDVCFKLFIQILFLEQQAQALDDPSSQGMLMCALDRSDMDGKVSSAANRR
jgi:hypothetical protein